MSYTFAGPGCIRFNFRPVSVVRTGNRQTAFRIYPAAAGTRSVKSQSIHFMKQLLLLFLSVLSLAVQAQITALPADRQAFERYIEQFAGKKEMPTARLALQTALFFRGAPYVAATLEKEPEQLVVDLREFDCTTLIETSLALARALRSDSAGWPAFCRELQLIRYRNGEIKDYASRKHYISDWIADNERLGLVKEITREIGGKPRPQHVSFMSEHPDKYKQLAADPALRQELKKQEDRINEQTVFYVPKEEIGNTASRIRSGDILCFTTTWKGLDVSHMGFAYRIDGELTFVHASSTAGKVIVNPEPLSEYVKKVKHNDGIRVVRPL